MDTMANDPRCFVCSHDDKTGEGEPKSPFETPNSPARATIGLAERTNHMGLNVM